MIIQNKNCLTVKMGNRDTVITSGRVEGEKASYISIKPWKPSPCERTLTEEEIEIVDKIDPVSIIEFTDIRSCDTLIAQVRNAKLELQKIEKGWNSKKDK